MRPGSRALAILLAATALAAACDAARPGPQPDFTAPLPGADPFDAALVRRLEEAWRARDPGEPLRTRHLRPDGAPRFTNRLFLESSPYLRQHAHNPVSWYPWGDEAFDTARRLGRPVLVSVGYSTCHWCHVMEEESFEDEEVARVLNERYVAIKVDREEHPDVDAVYMAAVLAMTGSGGWPMNVWVTADRAPFFGGTYFPPRDGDRGVATGFLTLLRNVADAWASEPGRVTAAATTLAQVLRDRLAAAPAALDVPDAEILHRAAREAGASFDPVHGGVAGAPKFPSSMPVRFLLRYHRRSGDPRALAMAELTLEKMAAGGVYDQIGGGFHRYSTDRAWLVPHFEKMLYDNALLVLAYLDGFQATGREDFARVARETLAYLDRDMSTASGGFASASDADSATPDGRREEGYFFTWTPEEIVAALGADRAPRIAAFYGVSPQGDLHGRSILHVAKAPPDAARDAGLSPEALAAEVAAARPLLLAARSRRPAPLRDDKVLAAWNGLAISAFAQAAIVLGAPSYAERAARAAELLVGAMRPDGRLRRVYHRDRAHGTALLDDHAFAIAGLLDLREATGDPRWLREAVALDSDLERRFEDAEHGGFFRTPDDHASLLVREKPDRDGAEPSGNSVQALNLLRLHDATGDDRYRVRAERTLAAFGARLRRSPAASSEMLLAVDYRLDMPKEIAVVTPASRAEAEPFLARLRRTFLPNRLLIVAVEGEDAAAQGAVLPLLQEKVARGGRATAYVCERRVCALPTDSPEVFARQIATVAPLPPPGGAPPPRRAPSAPPSPPAAAPSAPGAPAPAAAPR